MKSAVAIQEWWNLESPADLEPMIEAIGDSRYALLGEATHGTHEYYTWRASISKRLIQEKDFRFIAVEGDWPDCYRINRYIKGYDNSGSSAVEVLSGFKRWPTWMWANWEMVAFVEWLRDFNKNQPVNKKVGFYGLDVYSLWESMDVIISYLEKEDPASAKVAKEAARCFEPYEEGHDYAHGLVNLNNNCQREVIRLLETVRRHASTYDHDREAAMNAEMNARVIANAEQYYRSMISFRDESWNLRDSHMVETLDFVRHHHGGHSKAIVWEHNTHLGDARYTDMHSAGMYNVGQLVREQHKDTDGVFIAGFASYNGTVVASRSWGGEMEAMNVPNANPASLEWMLHMDSPYNKLILLNNKHWRKRLSEYIPHRAIGVLYNPEYEKGNYVPSLVADRYDALIFINEGTALHPLHLKPDGSQMPETYPFGL